MCPELEFFKSLWGLGTGEEQGYRTGPPGYISWRNSFLGIDLKIRAPDCAQDVSLLHIAHFTYLCKYRNISRIFQKYKHFVTRKFVFTPPAVQ
jgi:hypothetical protein